MLLERQGLAVLLLRRRMLAETLEQGPQAVVAPGQFLAIRGHGGEVGGQFLLDRQALAVLLRRRRTLAETGEQEPQVVVAPGQ